MSAAVPIPSSLRDGTLTVRGAGIGQSVVVQYVNAGFKAAAKRNLTKVRNRHLGVAFIEGLDADHEGTLTLHYTYDLAFGAEATSLREAVKREGRAAAWTSTAPAGAAYALDWEFAIAMPGGGRSEVHTLSGVVVSNLYDWTESDEINSTEFPIMAIGHSVATDS